MRNAIVAIAMCLCHLSINAKEIPLFTSLQPNEVKSLQVTSQTGLFHIETAQAASLRSLERTSITGLALPDGNPIVLDVQQFHLFDSDATFREGTDNGEKELAAPDILFFRGTVAGEKKSFVYFSLTPARIEGFIESGDERYLLSTLTQNVFALSNEHTTSQPSHAWECISQDVGFSPGIILRDSVTGETSVPIKIALEADYETYKKFQSNIDTAVAYITSLYGAVAAIYERDAHVTLMISYLRVWSTPNDPYTALTLSSALTEFRNYWESNQKATTRATAQLLSTKDEFAGGLSYVDALCTGYGYGVCGIDGTYSFLSNAYIWDVHVTAHELGHNFGALHSHNCSWAPAIDSCYTPEGGCFSGIVPAWGGIMSYCHIYGLGVKLSFHPKIGALLHDRAEAAPCNSLPRAEILLPLSPFSFGNVEAGSAKRVSIEITNPGNADLIITRMETSGGNAGDYSIEFPVTLTIASGGSMQLPVRFTPSGNGIRQTTLKLTHNASGSQSVLTLVGNGTVSSVREENRVTARAIVEQNFPNPFARTASTVIRFTLQEASTVTLTLVNTMGKIVRTILEAHYNPGSYQSNVSLQDLPGGMYVYRLQTETGVVSCAMILME